MSEKNSGPVEETRAETAETQSVQLPDKPGQNLAAKEGAPPLKKVGRPTVYNQDYCQMLITHMAQGLSFESFGGTVKHSKQTLYEWVAKFKDFGDAKRQGEEAGRLFWERKGIEGLWGDKEKGFFNDRIWALTMKNRFGYRDKVEVDSHSVNYQMQPVTDREIRDIIQSDPFMRGAAEIPRTGELEAPFQSLPPPGKDQEARFITQKTAENGDANVDHETQGPVINEMAGVGVPISRSETGGINYTENHGSDRVGPDWPGASLTVKRKFVPIEGESEARAEYKASQDTHAVADPGAPSDPYSDHGQGD